jgi:hypothetical protein
MTCLKYIKKSIIYIFMPFLVHSGPRHVPGGKKKMFVITVDDMPGNI